jgi:hypothetical protein
MHDRAPALAGRVTVSVVDTSGALTARVSADNAIVNAGRTLAAQRLVGLGTAAPISHLAVGTGTTAATPADTALVAESATIDRAPIDSTPLSGSIGFRVRAQVSSAANAQINEAGLFTAPAHGAGTMYNRVVFPSPLPIGPGLDLIFEWDVTF